MTLADVISGSPNDIPVVVGAIVTLVGGFFAISKIMLNQASKDREADRSERKEFIKVLGRLAESNEKGFNKVAGSMQEVATATTKGADEAKQRNGHLAELITQQGENTQKIADAAVGNIVDSLAHQHVDTQTVDTQVIKGKK